MGKHGIQQEHLTFLDDLDLDDLVKVKENSVKVTLVDHHVLSSKVKCLQSAVVEVFDHRPLEGELPERYLLPV